MTFPHKLDTLEPELNKLYHVAVNGSIRVALFQAIMLGWEMAEGELQAKIDRLMLEFCPEDMTAAQIAAWEQSQKAAKDIL